MISGPTGCLSQVQSSYPFGTHVLDCSLQVDQIREPARLGKICVGPGGYDACHTLNPVRPATWGQVKATYRHGVLEVTLPKSESARKNVRRIEVTSR